MTQINIMALRHSAFYTPLLLTIAGGYLDEEGLEPSYAIATPERTIADCLNDGSCHVAQSAVAASFAALELGQISDIVHFAQINGRDGFFIAARQPDTDFDWYRLEGRKVLVDHFFQPLAMFKYALFNMGINFEDLDVVDAGDVVDIDRAFRRGDGDYVHMQGPFPQQLEYEGLGHVVAAVGDIIGPVAFSSLCARRSWLQTDLAEAFTRAYSRACEHAVNGEALEIAAREQEAGFFTNIDSGVLGQTIADYQQLDCWSEDITISEFAYQNLIDVFLYNGLINEAYAYDTVITRPPGL